MRAHRIVHQPMRVVGGRAWEVGSEKSLVESTKRIVVHGESYAENTRTSRAANADPGLSGLRRSIRNRSAICDYSPHNAPLAFPSDAGALLFISTSAAILVANTTA